HHGLASFPTRRSSDLRAAGSPDTIALPGSASRTRRTRRSSPSVGFGAEAMAAGEDDAGARRPGDTYPSSNDAGLMEGTACRRWRSEEHTSELQSLAYL